MAKATGKSKKRLLISLAFVMIGASIFIGSTFAWFKQSIPVDYPTFRLGALWIEVYTHNLDSETAGLPFVFDMENKQRLKKDPSAFINEENWEPGIKSAKLVEIENVGSIDAKLRISLDITDDGLIDTLWYDFIPATYDEDTGEMVLGRPGVIRNPMDELLDSSIVLKRGDAPKGETVYYVLVYGMYEDAGDEYQGPGKSISADFAITAYQKNPDAEIASNETP